MYIHRTKGGMRGQTLSGDCGSVSGVLVCWSLDLGSTPDRSLSFSFPLNFFGLCKYSDMFCCVPCVGLQCITVNMYIIVHVVF